MKVKQIANIETAIRIYYQYPEIGNKQIKELFGGRIGTSTISAYKEAVRQEQSERNIKTACKFTVNTELAYEVWGIDILDLERRQAKLKQLGILKT